MEKKLYVLLGDVISSRKIKNREDFQEKLINAYDKLNIKYTEDIYADFKIIKGLDEIGAALNSISNIYEMITEIQNQIYPNSMRFVLVLDTIDTGLEEKDITKMDGPAFHKASSLMTSLKESKSFFCMSVEDKQIEKLIINVINVTLSYRERWNQKQRQVIKEYEITKNQKKVAKKYNISQQAVSNRLKTANWKAIKELEKSLTDLIKLIDHQDS